MYICEVFLFKTFYRYHGIHCIFLSNLYSARAELTGKREAPILFNGFRDPESFYRHLTEHSIKVFTKLHYEEQEHRLLLQRMLEKDVEEKSKLCYVDEAGRFVHANLNILRDFIPVEAEELTRTESHFLQHFIKVQHYFIFLLQQLLQEENAPILSPFRWKGRIGQLVELGDAMLFYLEPVLPQANQKMWFEVFCHFMHRECPIHLNQELQKKRYRYENTRFLQEMQNAYREKYG